MPAAAAAPPAPAPSGAAIAAPAAAPVSTPAPTSPPAPSTASGPRQANDLDDAYAALGELAGGEPTGGSQSGGTGPGDDATPPPETEPPETPPTTPPANGKPVKTATLRASYDALKKQFNDLQTKHAALEAERAKPLPEDPEKARLSETLTAREKRLAELEDTVRFTNYERSTEYQENYWKPFESAIVTGRNKTAGLQVVERKDDVGEVIQAGRKGTPEDFEAIVQADDVTAARLAAQLFGDAAPQVLYHRERAIELNWKRVSALETFKKEGAARETARATATQKAQKENAELWKSEIERGVKDHPAWFAPVEGDAKGNESLERGRAMAEAAFSGNIKDKETGQMRPMTGTERARLHAAAYNFIAAFPRLAAQLRAAKAELTKAQNALKEYEESGAPPRDGSGGNRQTRTEGGNPLDQAFAELDKLAH